MATNKWGYAFSSWNRAASSGLGLGEGILVDVGVRPISSVCEGIEKYYGNGSDVTTQVFESGISGVDNFLFTTLPGTDQTAYNNAKPVADVVVTAAMLGDMVNGMTVSTTEKPKMPNNIQGPLKGETISVQHVVGSANQAQSVLDGINPEYFNMDSRFGDGFYVGTDSETIVAELAEHGNTAKYAISYDMDLSRQNVLDLTNPEVASKWNFKPNQTSIEACQNIGNVARENGYSAIKVMSYRGEGTNFVLFNNFEDILQARNVTPVI